MGEAKCRLAAAKAADDFAKVYRNWEQVPLSFTDDDRGQVSILSFSHDENCPAIGTGDGCICNPIVQRFRMPRFQ